jgi:porin
MKKIIKSNSILILSLLMFLVIKNVESQNHENVIEASITQDMANNFYGGMKSGNAYLGLINLDFSLRSESMNLWENGTFRIHIQNTYGQTPTENLVGDIQVFSNIENGTYTYLYQFWYKQQIGNFSFLIGKHDLNEAFFASDYAGEYINSSFGIMPIASLNVPVSIFPMTTLGFVSNYDLNETMSLRGGIYNGRPGEITHNNFGTNLNLNKNNGLFYVGEFHFKNIIENKPGTYKVGYFHHSGEFQKLDSPESKQKGAAGIYFIADQSVFLEGSDQQQGLGTMFQAGYSPASSSVNDFYLAYGLNYTGLFPGRDSDKLGLAVAHASLNNTYFNQNRANYRTCETALELTYKYHLFDNLVVQPNMQYIIHPGMQNNYDNAFVGMIRVNWSYN